MRKIRTFGKLWTEEGPIETLNILKAQIHLLLLRQLRGEGLVKRYIPATGFPMYLDLQDEGLSRVLFYRGIHEPLSTQWVREELTNGMTVIDIGANLGYYVLLEASQIGPEGKIYAIEPNPITFEILQKNIQLNQLKNVESQCIAVAAEIGQVEMHIARQFNWTHLPHKNLDSDRAKDMLRWVRKTVPVNTTTLDDFVQQHNIQCINFVRMDVEGYEIEVIKGGLRTLSAHRPLKISMEVHPFLTTDITLFVEMVANLYVLGFRVKYIGYKTDVVARWPSLEQVTNYLSDGTFSSAPYLLFTAE